MIVFEYCVILGLNFFSIKKPKLIRSKKRNKTELYKQKIKPYGIVKTYS
jgi:hypothetical protein